MKYIFLLVISIILSLSSFSQGNDSKVLKHTIDYFKSERDTVSEPDLEVLLVGTFHFRSKNFKIPELEKQIKNFSPNAIFIEEVPPSSEESYKELYKNELYENPKRGSQFYTNSIDSAVSFSGISRKDAPAIIKKNKKGIVRDKQEVEDRIRLINALFIDADDANAQLQIAFLKDFCLQEDISFDSIKTKISPLHIKYRFYMGETKFLSIPLAMELNHEKLYPMDYQKGRKKNDSLLNLASKKMVGKIAWKIWKMPYMIKMMSLDRKGPKNDKDAARLIKILNQPKTIINMAKVHEKYLYTEKLDASKVWLQSYQNRNQEMVAQIKKNAIEEGFEKIVVIVGASHIPYFMYEIEEQIPNVRINMLDLEKL